MMRSCRCWLLVGVLLTGCSVEHRVKVVSKPTPVRLAIVYPDGQVCGLDEDQLSAQSHQLQEVADVTGKNVVVVQGDQAKRVYRPLPKPVATARVNPGYGKR
jgi:hypothetical protein